MVEGISVNRAGPICGLTVNRGEWLCKKHGIRLSRDQLARVSQQTGAMAIRADAEQMRHQLAADTAALRPHIEGGLKVADAAKSAGLSLNRAQHIVYRRKLIQMPPPREPEPRPVVAEAASAPSFRRWSPEEKAELVRLYDLKLPYAEIGRRLTATFGNKRTEHSVDAMTRVVIGPNARDATVSQGNRMAAATVAAGMRRKQRLAALVQRKCLCCERMFGSHGIGNRMCGPCKGSDG
jgi:hypothetical protein